ncbi:amidohydrolase family protein [Streptomyces lydicus]
MDHGGRLRAATSLPARHFGLTDRGAVEPGLRADLVLIDSDPVADIRATRQIRAHLVRRHRAHPGRRLLTDCADGVPRLPWPTNGPCPGDGRSLSTSKTCAMKHLALHGVGAK